MKKILGISLVAMMAVNAAHANIASEAYVSGITGALADLQTTETSNLVAAINSVKTTANNIGTLPSEGFPEGVDTVGEMLDDLNTTKADAASTTAGTYPKVTVNTQGIVTAGAALVANDIPDISATYVPQAQAASTSRAGIIEIADADEISAGTSTTTAVTPAQLKAVSNAITSDAVNSVALASGTNNGTVKLTVDNVETDNIAVTGLGSMAYETATNYVPQTQAASTSQAGIIEIADATEISAGTSTTTAVTPAQLAAERTTAGNTYVAKAQGNTAAEQNKALITDNSGNVTLGTITSGMITDATIVNEDIASDAAIGMGKIAFPALENSAAGAYVLTGVSDGNNGITYHWELITRPAQGN